MLRSTVTCLVCAFGVTASALNSAPIVSTDDGPVQGERGEGVTTYHGVPFAAPPVAALRWKVPQRPKPWTEVKSTTKFGAICPQFDILRGIHLGDENCLYLSMYVPDSCTVDTPCPVMQWIYGGAWILGDNYEFGEYNATHFAKTYNVIVVAGNYRLDALGWLALKEMSEESADRSFGNFGLADQRFALQWTQRNIKAFGGDPNTVTIFGESAGAYSVCQHIVSPQSDGLFSRAIIQSGDCDGPWMIHDGEDATSFGSVYATDVGCPAGASRMECLRQLPLKDVLEPYVSWFCPPHGTPASQSLVKLRQHMGFEGDDPWCNKTRTLASLPKLEGGSPTPWKHWPTPVPPMAPIVGFAAVVDGSERGLPDVPLRLIQAGKVNRSPKGDPIRVIMGTNHDEMALFMIAFPLVIPSTKLPVTHDDLTTMVSYLVQYHNNWNETTAQQMLSHYPESEYNTPASRFVTFATDFVFRCGTRTSVRAFESAGVAAYLYQFSYQSRSYKNPSSLFCELDDEIGCGVFHGDDISYVFGNHESGDGAQISSTIGRYWTNFAKTGSPNGVGVPITWEQYDAHRDNHLELTLPVTNGSRLSEKNCDFWDTLPKQGKYPSSALSEGVYV